MLTFSSKNRKFGKINHIVNNAGFTFDKMLHTTPDETFDIILKIHVRAPFRLIRQAAPYFRLQARTLELSPLRQRSQCGCVVARPTRKSFNYQRVIHFWPAWQRWPGKLLCSQGGCHWTYEDHCEGMGSVRSPCQYRRLWSHPYQVCSESGLEISRSNIANRSR